MPRLAWASKSSCASSIAKPLPAAWAKQRTCCSSPTERSGFGMLQDRFSEARQRLDLYHGDEHLWAVANELSGKGTPEARQWVALDESLHKKVQTQIDYLL